MVVARSAGDFRARRVSRFPPARGTCRSGRFEVTSDRDFAGVISGCATAGGRTRRTWLTAPMIAAYRRLFDLGHAHSVEVWREGKLVGGTYGVAIGGLFAGESMFHVERDASKVALAYLVPHLRQRGYRLFDIQELSPHTASLGAIEIPRTDYLDRLANAVDCPATFGAVGFRLPASGCKSGFVSPGFSAGPCSPGPPCTGLPPTVLPARR